MINRIHLPIPSIVQKDCIYSRVKMTLSIRYGICPRFIRQSAGETFIDIVVNELRVSPRYSVLKKWMVKAAGIFDKTTSESYEMLYQYEFNYHFDSSKFNKYFDYKPKPYNEGIKETIRFVKNNVL